MVELDNLYRMIILYMLSRVEYPLTNTQITRYLLDKDYTDYFTIQQSLMDLLSSGLITASSTHNNTRYSLTDDGEKTLEFFNAKVSDEIKEEINEYLLENNMDLKKESQVFADFYKASGRGYTVRCQIKGTDREIMTVEINVDTKEQAQAICGNWMDAHGEVYSLVMEALLK